MATGLANLADLQKTRREFAESEILYKRSLAIVEKAYGPEHREVANVLQRLAILYTAEGRSAEGEQLMKRSQEIRAKIAAAKVK